MGHGTHSLDLRAVLHLGQTVGRADATAQNGSISAVVACALALCAAGAELHDAAGGVSVEAGDAGGLGGDEAVEVHGLEQVGLDEDSAYEVALDAHHLHMGVADRAFGQSVHIALPAVRAQILAELLTHALGAQPVDILLIEVVVQQETGQLALAGADGVALVIRVLAEEHIKHKGRILKAVQKQAVGHSEFVKINDHCRIVVVLIRDIRHNFDLAHEKFPLFFPRTPAAGAAKQTLRCRAFRPVMTGCLYHYSIFGGQTQEVLAKNDDRKKKCFLRNLYQHLRQCSSVLG